MRKHYFTFSRVGSVHPSRISELLIDSLRLTQLRAAAWTPTFDDLIILDERRRSNAKGYRA